MRTRWAKYAAATAAAVAIAAAMVPAWGQVGSGASLSAKVKADTSENVTLIKDLAAARKATAKYSTDLGRAKHDGYAILTQMIPNTGYHFLNPNMQAFNVRKPPILVYEHTGHNTWQLGALEWVFPQMPATPPLPNATFGTFPAACQYKDGTFIPDGFQNTCPATNPDTGAKFTFWHPLLFTMHVWIWYPNPEGLYASENPLVTPFNGG